MNPLPLTHAEILLVILLYSGFVGVLFSRDRTKLARAWLVYVILFFTLGWLFSHLPRADVERVRVVRVDR